MADEAEYEDPRTGSVTLNAGCHLGTPPTCHLIDGHLVFFCSVCETFVASFELKDPPHDVKCEGCENCETDLDLN